MIQIDGLTFQYPRQSVQTLHGLSFSIGEGEIFGFLGPSGSGKSTTQKILYKLLPDFQGEIQFKGQKLQSWDRRFYEHIGVCFELPNHYQKLSGRENLAFFAAFYPNAKPRIDFWLERLGLIEDADKRLSSYSKGMKMRLNFIRSLIHDPPVLFLDEPTSGLDPINSRIIKDIILELKQEGRTIFLTTHNMFDAEQLCDRVALLHQGKIQAIDSPEKLKLAHGNPQLQLRIKGKEKAYLFPLADIGRNEDFLNLIKEQAVETIHSKEASLEEVFIKLTGTSLNPSN